MVKLLPMDKIEVSRKPLALVSFATVVLFFAAIEERVSPFLIL